MNLVKTFQQKETSVYYVRVFKSQKWALLHGMSVISDHLKRYKSLKKTTEAHSGQNLFMVRFLLMKIIDA